MKEKLKETVQHAAVSVVQTARLTSGQTLPVSRLDFERFNQQRKRTDSREEPLDLYLTFSFKNCLFLTN